MPESRVWVEGWGPQYGSFWEIPQGLEPTEEEVAPYVETREWAPRSPPDVPWPGVAFLDGVGRIDARAFLDSGGVTVPGLCGSVAAGAVLVESFATFGPSEVRRTALFGLGAKGTVPASSGLIYESRAVPGSRAEDLYLGLHGFREEVEHELATILAGRGWIVVADGAIGIREPLPVIGLIKSHHKLYLGPDLEPVLRALLPGQRTPLFMFGIIRPRYSWYLRVAAEASHHPWASVVRCEVSATLDVDRALALADLTARHLPRFASKPFWDERAPQNLVPIAALERRLWHLLGDRGLVYRRLRSAFRPIPDDPIPTDPRRSSPRIGGSVLQQGSGDRSSRGTGVSS